MNSNSVSTMNLTRTALCLAMMIGGLAHGQTVPNQVGMRYMGAADTDGNTMSRVSVDGWVHRRTPESDRDDTKWNSFYEATDLSTQLVNKHTIPQVITDGSAKTGAFVEFATPVDISSGTIKFRVRSDDWANIHDFSLILSSDGTKFERTFTADMTAIVTHPVDNQWMEVSVSVERLEQWGEPDARHITAMLWKTRARGDQTINTQIDNLKVERVDGSVIHEMSTVIPRPEMIRERDRQDWGISLSKTNYTTDVGTKYNGQGLTALANYHNGGFSLVGELGVGQLNNLPNKNFLLGDMTATYKVNRYFSVYAGLYGDAVASDAGLAAGATFTGVSLGAELSKDGLGGITGGVYQQNYSNNNVQQGFVAKVYADTPIPGVNVYLSTKQYTNSLPYNGLFYSPAQYQRYNIGVGYSVPLNPEWTLSGHADIGVAYADGQASNVNSFRVALDKTLAKDMTAGIAIGSDINPSNNYRYNYVMGTFRYAF